MLIIIHKQSKRKSYILRTLCLFLNIDFQCSKGGLTFSGKYHDFTYVLSEMYLMTKCGKNGIKVVYNYTNKKSIITMGRQNVNSESTPSRLLTL